MREGCEPLIRAIYTHVAEMQRQEAIASGILPEVDVRFQPGELPS